MGEKLLTGLKKLENYDFVKEIRGRGLFIAGKDIS